jgi:hypothetical protein
LCSTPARDFDPAITGSIPRCARSSSVIAFSTEVTTTSAPCASNRALNGARYCTWGGFSMSIQTRMEGP